MAEKTILLVEDNEDDVELTLRAFRKFKIKNRLDVVRDGEEALDYLFHRGKFAEMAPHEHPAVVLLDLKLPKVDGLEVLRQIRETESTRLQPVVIVTSSKQETDLVRGYELGCNSYIQKPVDFSEFVEAVSTLGVYWLLLNEEPPR